MFRVYFAWTLVALTLACLASASPQRQGQIFEDGPGLSIEKFREVAQRRKFRLRQGMETFAGNFYGKMTQTQNGNILLSPFR